MRTALLVVLVACGPRPVAEVHVNEIVADNRRGERDEAGQSDDWLELVNVGDAAADLGGWGLTDALGEAEPWVFPPETSLLPGEFLVVWCDGDDGPLHADFELTSGNGELVALLDADGLLVEEVQYAHLWTDVSWARVPDGGDVWQHLVEPTPGATNAP